MQRKKRTIIRPWWVNTFIVLAGCVVTGSVANAQITRDVGEIAVIEGDNNIIFTPPNCSQVSVSIEKLAMKFYQTHGDAFQFLIMFTNFDHLLAPDNNCNEQTKAFFRLASNSIEGIGRSIFDNTANFGSSGVLGGMINMGNLADKPLDPTQRLPLNNDSMLSLFAQEVGHLWGGGVRSVRFGHRSRL